MVTSRWISRVLVISSEQNNCLEQKNNNQLHKKLSLIGAKRPSDESATIKLSKMTAAEFVLKMCQQIFLDFKFKTTNSSSSTIMASSTSENINEKQKKQWHRKTLSEKYNCVRCSTLVYPVDSIGPLKSSTYFHR